MGGGMNLAQLQEEARAAGVSTTGTKKELRARLAPSRRLKAAEELVAHAVAKAEKQGQRKKGRKANNQQQGKKKKKKQQVPQNPKPKPKKKTKLEKARERARSLGLSTSGSKKQLTQRIQEELKWRQMYPYDNTQYLWRTEHAVSQDAAMALALWRVVEFGSSDARQVCGHQVAEFKAKPLETYAKLIFPHNVYWTLATGLDRSQPHNLASVFKLGSVDSIEAMLAGSGDTRTLIEQNLEPASVWVAQQLIAGGANVCHGSPGEQLFHAAKKGFYVYARAFLLNGAPLTLEEDGVTVLDYAAAAGPAALIHDLVDRGADVNAVTAGTRLTPLARAAGQGNIGALRALIARGADIDATGGCRSPLHVAIANQQRGSLSELLPIADLNRADEEGLTPLIVAADLGYVGTVRALSVAGADINALSPRGTALCVAASKGSGGAAVVTALLSAGADVNAQKAMGPTPLAVAVEAAYEPVVRALIALGADVNAVTSRGSALHEAVRQQDCEWLVALLLNTSANIDALDENGQTPLVLAVSLNKTRVVAMLLAAGAGVNVTSPAGTALLVAVGNRFTRRITDVLLGAGADANALTDEGTPPLAIAARTHDANTIRALVEGGADISVCSKPDSSLLLEIAIETTDASLVSRLTSGGAELNGHGSETCPLALAVEHFAGECFAVVSTLLDAGADPSCGNVTDGPTALILAAARGYVEVVRILLDRGADINHSPQGQHPPIVAAIGSMHEQVVTLLVARRANLGIEVSHHGMMRTLAAYAYRVGSLSIARALVDAGAEVKRGCWAKHPAVNNTKPLISVALYHGADCSMIQKIVSKGADPAEVDSSGMTPLMYSVLHGDYATTNFICSVAPETVNQRGRCGSSVLHQAIEYAEIVARRSDTWTQEDETQLCIVRRLLELGSDCSVVDDAGKSALFPVLKGGSRLLDRYWPVVLKHAGHTRFVDERGRSLLVTASLQPLQPSYTIPGEKQIMDAGSVLRLCQLGISPNAFVGDDNEPLVHAARTCVDQANFVDESVTGACEILLKHGAATGAEAHGVTALGYVVARGRDDLVQAFVRHGADVDCGRVPPALLATKVGERFPDREAGLRQLLQAGADVSLPTSDGGPSNLILSSQMRVTICESSSATSLVKNWTAASRTVPELVVEYAVEPGGDSGWAGGVIAWEW